MNLDDLKRLAGITDQQPIKNEPHFAAQEKRKIEREKNIKVGSDEWMELWFKKEEPQLNMPQGFRGRKK